MKLSHWSGLNLKDLRSKSTSSLVVGVSITGSASSVVTGGVMGEGELVEFSFDAVDAVGGSAMDVGS